MKTLRWLVPLTLTALALLLGLGLLCLARGHGQLR